MESPSSNAVTSVYSGTAWPTGVPGSETPTSGGVPTAAAAVLSSMSGGKWAAAFARERCMGERPGDGVAVRTHSNCMLYIIVDLLQPCGSLQGCPVYTSN